MPRAKTILQSDYPYNISARCINKEWFNLSLELVWLIMCDELTKTVKKYNLHIHSFVLMSNHFHLIASTPDANISQCMHYFMKQSSNELTKNGNRINGTYAGRHYKCILQHYNYYLNAYKYNYRNPVASKICTSVEDYPFSTLKGLLYPSQQLIPIIEDQIFLNNSQKTLNWLNTPPDILKQEAFKNGSKHQFFKSAKDQNTKKLILTENDIL